MIHQVRDLVDGFRFVLGLACDDDLGGFLANLFQDFVQTLLEQVGGVGALRQGFFPALQQLVEAFHREGGGLIALENLVVEAGVRPEMAGGAFLVYCDYQRVAVTVSGNVHDVLDVAAGFAFAPQFLPGAGPEAGTAFLHGDFKALTVHVGQGQHLFALGVHHNGGDQTVGVEF